MQTPTWIHAVAVLAGTGAGALVAWVTEQAAAALVRRVVHRLHPLLAQPRATWVGYERGVFTPGVAALRWVRAGLGCAGVGLWVAVAWHAWVIALAVLAWAAALALDLRSWQGVAADDEQVAWRRSWRGGVWRLPLAQVAAVYVVERPAHGAFAALASALGLRHGTAYLALTFHNGRAIKLPRTDLQFGLPRVHRLADHLEQRQRLARRERRLALITELRARRRAARLLPDADELAFKRELAALRRGQAPARPPFSASAPMLLQLEYHPDEPAPG